jgi:WD40 repeat protein
MVLMSSCPDAQRLQQLLLGQIPDHEAEALESHLSECGHCLKTVRGLQIDDTLAEAMRSHAETPLPEPVQQLIRHLKALHPSIVIAADGCTPANAEATHDTAEVYDFLAPAQQAGELGRLGPYRVLKLLGSGGMGVVFEAEDIQLKRRVGLKVMKPSVAASDTARKRFLREAQAAARLNHDHIVHIYQVNEDRGVPFLAMQLLKGQSLEDRLARGPRLSMAEVLRIGRETAAGLVAAHQAKLIHRDIKPANIWLEGERGRIKLLDFGLARALTDDARLTQPGTIAGTPAYMAPEQARGEQIDARCDLFSLGCVLYRLCTGQAPFRGANTMAILLALAQDQPKPPREVNPEVPAPLSDLVMKLLAKKPEDRSASAAAVVATLAAIKPDPTAEMPVARPTLSDPTVDLRPATTQARPRRRYPVWVAVAAACMAGAVLLIPQVVIYIYDKDGNVIGKFEAAKAKVEEKGKPSVVFPRTDKDGKEEPKKEEPKKEEPRDKLAPAKGLDRLDPKQIPADEVFMWQPPELVAVLGQHQQRHWGTVFSAAISPDGKRFASGGGGDRRVVVGDAATGRTLGVLTTPGKSAGNRPVAFSPDSKTLACGDGTLLQLFDVTGAEPRPLAEFKAPALCIALAFAPDGKTLAASIGPGELFLIDLTGPMPTVREKFKAHDGVFNFLSFHPTKSRLATGDAKSALVWDLGEQPPKQVYALTAPGGFRSLTYTPDGNGLTGVSGGGVMRVWDVSGDKPREPVLVPGGDCFGVAYSPRGRLFAVGDSYGRSISLWDWTAAPKKVFTLPGNRYQTTQLAFSGDGGTLLSAGQDGAVRLWDLTGPEPRERCPLVGHSGEITALSFAPDDLTQVSAGPEGIARFWDLKETPPREWLVCKLPKAASATIALASHARPVALSFGSAYTDGDYLWDLIAPTANERYRFPVRVGTAAFAGGDRVAVFDSMDKGFVRLLDLKQRPRPPDLAVLEGNGYALPLAVSDDGKKLVCFAEDGQTIRVWDLSGKKPRSSELQSPIKGSKHLALTPDGKMLLLVGDGLQFWDLAGKDPKPAATLNMTQSWFACALAPDGKTFATSNTTGDVSVWNGYGLKPAFKWQFPGRVRCLAFAGDSRHLAVAQNNGTIYLMRLGPAKN